VFAPSFPRLTAPAEVKNPPASLPTGFFEGSVLEGEYDAHGENLRRDRQHEAGRRFELCHIYSP
jgi:hypothetical protein